MMLMTQVEAQNIRMTMEWGRARAYMSKALASSEQDPKRAAHSFTRSSEFKVQAAKLIVAYTTWKGCTCVILASGADNMSG
jgi:hypothetical protein